MRGLNKPFHIQIQQFFTTFFTDLALIRLEKTVNFNIEGSTDTWLSPICLPAKPVSLHEQTAYVSRRGRHEIGDCFTDSIGSKKNARCRYYKCVNQIFCNRNLRKKLSCYLNGRFLILLMFMFHLITILTHVLVINDNKKYNIYIFF